MSTKTENCLVCGDRASGTQPDLFPYSPFQAAIMVSSAVMDVADSSKGTNFLMYWTSCINWDIRWCHYWTVEHNNVSDQFAEVWSTSVRREGTVWWMSSGGISVNIAVSRSA